jgi:hypothetical protein
VSFFDELPDFPRLERSVRDPSMGPSQAELPVGVPLSLAVARNDRAALILGPIQVYSDGFEIGANLLVRDHDEEHAHFFDPFSRHHWQPKDAIVRLAFVFADGTSVEAFRGLDGESERTLVPMGGGGGPGRWSTSFWSWPLPPPGKVEVVCTWPVHGIAETRTSFDAQPILDAAARVEQLWPEPPGDADSGTWTMYAGSDGSS